MTGRADRLSESEAKFGRPITPAEGLSEAVNAFARGDVDSLRLLTATWEDIQKTRLAASQRGQDDLASVLKSQEDRYARQIKRELEKHAIWPWLSQFPGLGGVHTARLIGYIGDPRRFPGQRCDKGHYSAPLYMVGTVCPVTTIDGPCEGVMLPPRPHTGTRSLWHWAGLMPGARRKKGQRADFNPIVKTLVLMPGGLAEQIVRSRVPHYRDVYDATKDRLNRERADGLRPFQIDAIARKVAAKKFVGDLLAEMKRVAAVEKPESDSACGGGAQLSEAA